MNPVDILLILIFILAVISGYRNGFVFGFFNLIGWLLSLTLTLVLYPHVIRLLDLSEGSYNVWTIPLIFFICFVVIRIIISGLAGLVINSFPRVVHESLFNKVLGVLPGALNGFIYAALLATLLLLLPFSASITEKTRESGLALALSEPVSEVEARLSPVFDDAIRRSIGKLTVAPQSDQFVNLPYKVSSPEARPDLEEKMLAMINEERATAGLAPLAADHELKSVARKHSADMFARGYFSHYTPEGKDPFDRMRAEKVRFITAGENLSLARTLHMAHDGLMQSPGHRANILRPSFGRVGIGVLDGGIYGLMITQNFRN